LDLAACDWLANHRVARRTDYYQLLGLQKGANEKQMKKAYRKMALEYHPVRF
jgi:DnaJ-class molecular chaperone